MSRQSEMRMKNSEQRFKRISPADWMGLTLILSALALLFVDRATRGFALLSSAFGCVVGIVLYLWHKWHPLP
jgi:hypothetical protein